MLAARPTTLMEAVPAKRLQHQAKTNSLQHGAEGCFFALRATPAQGATCIGTHQQISII